VTTLNASHHVKISTVGLGDDHDAKFLDQLAMQNGGSVGDRVLDLGHGRTSAVSDNHAAAVAVHHAFA
jgi:hypothetical protein